MSKKILFVHLASPTYTQIEDEMADANHAFYGLADGSESSPTVSTTLQRGERKYNVKAGMNLPLGITYISAALKKEFPSIDCNIADYVAEQDSMAENKSVDDWILKVAQESMTKEPDIIAVSLMFSTSHKFAKHVVTIYKKLWPKATIVVGGIHATNCSQHIIETMPEVDYVFRGESEVAMTKFVQNFIDGTPQNIQGVHGRNTGSDFSSLCEIPQDLNELPNPDYRLTKFEDYFAASKLFKRYDGNDSGIYEILGSRGCPFKCSFCSSHSSNDRDVRTRSIDNIMREITHMYKEHGITRYLFNDDLFTIKKERFFSMIEAFAKSDIPDLQFFTQGFHIDTTNEEMIDAVSDMTDAILFAVDSGSQYIQDNVIFKKNDLKRGRQLIAYSREKGLIVRSNFIFGFPGETKELMEESANYMRSLDSDWFQIFTAIPFIGTTLHEQLLESGVFTKRFDEQLWERSRYGERQFDMETITAEELATYTYSLNLELNFVNSNNLRPGRYERAIVMFSDLLSNYPTHVFGLIALYLAYEGLNDKGGCRVTEKRITDAAAVDGSSRKMLEKYRGLLEHTKFYDLGLQYPVPSHIKNINTDLMSGRECNVKNG
jgi:anaerobic magnesium-protoporphyrin IX monomethyl ester cyclase